MSRIAAALAGWRLRGGGRFLLLFGCLALFVTGGMVPAMAEGAQPIPVAIADFDNFDTAGEAPDRSAQHADRVKAFAGRLRDSLAGEGRYRIVPLVCPRSPCSPETMPPAGFLQV